MVIEQIWIRIIPTPLYIRYTILFYKNKSSWGSHTLAKAIILESAPLHIISTKVPENNKAKKTYFRLNVEENGTESATNTL